MENTNADIGLPRGTVKLVAHDPKWAEYFSEEKQLLFKSLGRKVLDIRHIGSTSIAEMPAKPILDILAAVATLADVQSFVRDLNKIGDFSSKAAKRGERDTQMSRGNTRN